MRKWPGLVACCASLLLAATGRAQQGASISGFVTDAGNGEALIGATVYLADVQVGGATNASGYYVLPGLPAGPHELVCVHVGYGRLSRAVSLVPGQPLVLDLAMQVEVLQTEGMTVRADSLRTIDKLFRKTISQVDLTPRQIRQIPQVAEADLLRSLQTLPGILPLSDFSSALYVRGGTPDQNLYLVDGTDVYNPEHAFGVFSTFNTDAVKQVRLSKGGFGAEYGGRLSSVLDVANLDGNRERVEGSVSVSLLSAKATLQAPLGSRGSLSGSVRRTYFDQTVARALDDIPDYYFYDGNLKAFIDLGPNDKLSLSAYGGRDYLDVLFSGPAEERTGFRTDWGNRTGSLRWTHVFTPRWFGTFWTTGSRFTSDFAFAEGDLSERNRVTDISVKGSLEYHHTRELAARFGFEQKRLAVRYEQPFAAGRVDIGSRPEHWSAYATGHWRPALIWDVEVGARVEAFHSDATYVDVDPRLSVKVRVSERTNLKAAAGIYHQYLHRVPRLVSTDIWTAANADQRPSRAVHWILGVQRELARDCQLEVEAYVKTYDRIYSFSPTFLTELHASGYDADGDPVFTATRGLFNRGEGYSTGVEGFVRREAGTVTGWLGYSLSRTRLRVEGTNAGDAFAPRHDRTHTVNLVANVDLRAALRRQGSAAPGLRRSGSWRLGANLVYSTGQPFTEPGSGYLAAASPDAPVRYVEYAPTRINNVRFPAYVRLDVSITWEHPFRGGSIAPYLQVFNAGSRRNVWFVEYEYTAGVPGIDPHHMFPILPTAGLTCRF